jgi:hypothetical protein
MAHTISERRLRQRIKEFAPERERQTRRELRHAQRIVELWNKRAQFGRRPSFFPTIRTVLTADMPILDVLCPACQTVGSVDIRALDRHPDMAISGLIPSLSCRFCCDNPPFAMLIGLRKAERRW